METEYLNLRDIEKLKKIGSGMDGTVYRAKNGKLFKIYHDTFGNIQNGISFSQGKFDTDGVRIAIKKKIPIQNKQIGVKCFDVEGVRQIAEEGISKAIERQKKITRTQLPIGVLYVNGRFKGCILKEHKHHLDLLKTCFFPMYIRVRIFEEIVKSVRELLGNNIYHTALCNRPTTAPMHSNILVSKDWLLKPQIIDLDGETTIYCDKENERYYTCCIETLNLLALEFLYKLDFEFDFEIEDKIYLKKILISRLEKKLEACLVNFFADILIERNAKMEDFIQLIEEYDKHTKRFFITR